MNYFARRPLLSVMPFLSSVNKRTFSSTYEDWKLLTAALRRRVGHDSYDSSSRVAYRDLLRTLNPNQYDPRPNPQRILSLRPVLCELIKDSARQDKDHPLLKLLKRLVGEQDIFLSTDLTEDDQQNPLITAILFDNPRAAQILLASGRCQILQKDNPKDPEDSPRTALEYLDAKIAALKESEFRPYIPSREEKMLLKDWENLRDLCEFLLAYPSMSHWLRQNCRLTPPHGSLRISKHDHATCPLVYFYSDIQDRQLFEGLRDRANTGAQSGKYEGSLCKSVQEQKNSLGEEGCLLILNEKTLGNVLGKPAVASFLLTQMNEIFWTETSAAASKFRFEMTTCEGETVLDGSLLPTDLLSGRAALKSDFYQQLIREKLAFREIVFDHASPAAKKLELVTSLEKMNFLLQAMTRHPALEKITFYLGIKSQLQIQDFCRRLVTVPRLKQVHFHGTDGRQGELSDLVAALTAIAAIQDKLLEVQIDGLKFFSLADKRQLLSKLSELRFQHKLIADLEDPLRAEIQETLFPYQQEQLLWVGEAAVDRQALKKSGYWASRSRTASLFLAPDEPTTRDSSSDSDLEGWVGGTGMG